MSDDLRLERLLSDGLHDLAPSRAPDRLRPAIHAETIATRPRFRWLALIKEPPMRLSSHLAVGSPTARVAAILAATLLLVLTLAAAGIAGGRLLAASDVLVVDQDDPGAYQSIAAAVADAADGDTVLIRPGRYVESVPVIDKTVTIRGDGVRDDIVIEAAEAAYPIAGMEVNADSGVDTWALVLADSRATISGLTVLGNDSGTAITITGPGSDPTLQDLVVGQLGSLIDNSSIQWQDGASGVLRDSIVEGFVDVTGGTPEIMGNQLRRTCIDIWPDTPSPDTRVALHGNVIHGCPHEYGIWIENASASLMGNDISIEPTESLEADSEGRVAVILGGNTSDVTVADNDIHDSLVGIRVEDGAEATVENNRFVDNQTGLDVASDRAIVKDNTLLRGELGLLASDGSPSIEGNTIDAFERGLVVGFGATPTLVENTICGNATNLEVNELAETPQMSGNEICQDGRSG